MIIKVIPQYRALLFPCTDIGTMRENKATILNFDIPADLAEYTTKNFIISNDLGSYIFPLVENSVEIPNSATSAPNAEVQLVLNSPDGKEWSSQSYHVNFYNRIDDSGENIVDKAKSEQRESDRVELSEALTEITSEDLSGESWQGLLDKTKSLPLKTEQNVVDLTNYTALTYAFEHATTPPSLITGNYKLDKEEPDDPNSPDILIKLPFLETPNAVYRNSTRVSQFVEECGFSVKGSAKTIAGNERSMFNSLGGTVAANLRKLTLADSECVIDPRGMFNDCGSIEEITLIERGNNAEEYHTNYWYEFFRNCSNLQSILGTPLDMSRGTGYTRTFQKCSKLKCVRFKPLTISHDLDLSDCPALMKGKYEASSDDPGTLLSIVNGVREYTTGMNQITIKFSTFVKDYLTLWRCELNPETGLYVASTEGVTLATVLTNNRGVIIA